MKATQTPAPRRLYLDTSAYLCVLLGEDRSDAIAKLTAGAELLSSVLLVLETHRNLVRLAREGSIKPTEYKACLDRLHQDQDRFQLRDLTLDLCTSVALPAVSTPQSLDLAHLRTALWFHAESPLDRFVTLDDGQTQAARELGLPA